MRRTIPTSWRLSPRRPVADERELIERATDGDLEAYDELVRHHYRRVHATAFHLVGNPEDAEDLAQDCFLRAFKALGWYRGEGSFAGWLRRILVHLARDRFRRAGRRGTEAPLPGEGELAVERGPVHEAGHRELSRLVAEAVDRRLERAREARMKGFEGDPCNDCGNFTLVRNGTCLKCATCGATSGCS